VTANNSVLLNNLGNFVNRVIKFVNAKFDGVIPEFTPSYTDDSFDFPNWVAEVNGLLKEYVQDMDRAHLRAGIEKAMAISAHGNLLLQYRLDNASLEADPKRTHAVIGFGLNLCSLLASVLSPFVPSTADSIVQQLNTSLQRIPDTFSPDFLKAGHKIGKAAYLFTRIDEKKVAEWKEKYGGTAESRAAEAAAKKKRLEDKERKKAKKAAKNAPTVATEAGPSADGHATAPAPDSQTAAAGGIQELPIRGKPAE